MMFSGWLLERGGRREGPLSLCPESLHDEGSAYELRWVSSSDDGAGTNELLGKKEAGKTGIWGLLWPAQRVHT